MYIARKYQKRQGIPINTLANGIDIDLCTDFDRLLDKRLNAENVKRKNPQEPAMDYFRLMHRLIVNKPRKILKAAGFSCPPGYEQKLSYLENCIHTGKNLHPFMTRFLKQLKQEDLLLSDWGIYHLHISDRLDSKKKDGFMERSAYLLMARIEEDAVYFIKIIPHNTPNCWTLKEYIQIIQDNWPELLEKNKLTGTHLITPISDEEYDKCRKAHASTFVELDAGTLYGLIGGGYASDGTSMKAIQTYDYWCRLITSAEEVLVQDLKTMIERHDELKSYFAEVGIIEVHLLNFFERSLLLEIRNTDLVIRMDVRKDMRWNIAIVSKNRLHETF